MRAKKVLKIATKQTLYASKWMNDAENVCLCITRNIYKNGSLFIAGLASIFRQYLEKWCNIHECELREGLLKICYNKQFLCIEHSKFMCWPSLWLICMVSILHSKINVNLMFLTRKKHWNLPFEKKKKECFYHIFRVVCLRFQNRAHLKDAMRLCIFCAWTWRKLKYDAWSRRHLNDLLTCVKNIYEYCSHFI